VTEAERALLDLTVQLWNAFLALPDRHPADAEEMQRDIHNIQHRVMARVAVRENPEYFRK
jgi:hypothetical protein